MWIPEINDGRKGARKYRQKIWSVVFWLVSFCRLKKAEDSVSNLMHTDRRVAAGQLDGRLENSELHGEIKECCMAGRKCLLVTTKYVQLVSARTCNPYKALNSSTYNAKEPLLVASDDALYRSRHPGHATPATSMSCSLYTQDTEVEAQPVDTARCSENKLYLSFI